MHYLQDPKTIIQELQQQGYARIQVIEWTEQTRDSLAKMLLQAGVQDYQFHKIKNEPHDYLVVLKGNTSKLPYQLEKDYPSRTSFLKVLPLILAVGLIAVTVLFSSYSQDLMSFVIVLMIPAILGALFEYFMIRKQPNPIFLSKLFKIQPLVLVIVIVFCVIVLREGIICLIMLLPILLIGLLLGAGLMRLICHYLWKPSAKIYSFALLPLILWLLLPDFSRTEYGQTQRSVVIHAPAQHVFQAINQIGKIQPEEVKDSFIFSMGFPKPVFGMTEQHGGELIRTIQWERGIKFEEKVTASHAPYLLSWKYQFAPDSFPKGSLDDHLEMGGKYFDLLKTDYQLEQIDAHTTKLILSIDYRLSTEYNWYSRLWVNYVLNEFSDVVMQIHKQRLEKDLS
ncbi:hypothetical protein [Acinetobacter proteolyticus]|uniref:SRPBCC family protein n=1 Tax=Acinetobacter proteolyticus TaxID=1776741 RepID=A0A2N0WDL3_9GAMM|nr:hypothetical protein [Acinetobacter proteolyticus]PKF32789.1 hypothetical protein CW311_12125 [Acinetobacter proteolyticus]QHH93404.1 hypothetical protein FPL18_05910 [Acinetobacter gyllenbergii]